MTNGFSDYLVFVDESGDHGLDSIESEVSGFCVGILYFQIKRAIQQDCNWVI